MALQNAYFSNDKWAGWYLTEYRDCLSILMREIFHARHILRNPTKRMHKPDHAWAVVPVIEVVRSVKRRKMTLRTTFW
ncbi:hypothetical protein CGZ80_06800 [Rhodopirellula sp. MGV]|nr:hypothetical protein CGZ80_06800 [Rhodopirellula sp. MGV]PNY36186.1 hypothetical protein C2E31_13780 [Rhodopirellula baltica]